MKSSTGGTISGQRVIHARMQIDRSGQLGFVVIASLLILVVLTLIEISMTRSFWFQQSISGNVRETARAFNAAQAALQSAETWVRIKGRSTLPTSCGASAGVIDTTTVCSDAPASLTSVPLTTSFAYTSTYLPVESGGGVGKYYGNPGYHIQYLYSTSSANYYQITAYGYGGNRNAVAVVQSLVQIPLDLNNANNTPTKVTNLGGL